MAKLSNTPLKKYRKFLLSMGCTNYRNSGGHEHYTRKNLTRPLTLQSHIDPVPAFIIKQHLRYLNISTNEFIDILDNL